MKSRDELIKIAQAKDREESYLDFKREFNPKMNGDWIELIKDIVAFANTGNGIILFGVNDDGSFDNDSPNLKSLDTATFTDKVFKYTGIQFTGFELMEIERRSQKVFGLLISYSFPPLVFIKPGTYQDTNNLNKQKTGFSQGVLYVRHGSKSEPANSNDIYRIVEIEIDKRRKNWLSNIRKIVEAPQGSEVSIVPASLKATQKGILPIRITDDESAPEYKLTFWEFYKYRRKELVIELNKLLNDRKISAHDIQSVVKIYNITSNLKFATIPEGQGPRYSDEFIRWLIEQHTRNIDFFEEAREKYREIIYGRK